jgi:hypothetical protein
MTTGLKYHTKEADQDLINERLTLNVSPKTEATVKFFNDTIHWIGWNATPEHAETLKT